MTGAEFGERAVDENIALAAAFAGRSLAMLRVGADIAAELSGRPPRDIPKEEWPAQFMVSALYYLLPIEGASVLGVDVADEARNVSLAAQFSAQTGMDITTENVGDAYETLCTHYDQPYDAIFRDVLAADLAAAQSLAAERGIPLHEAIADDELYMQVQRESTKLDQVAAMTAATVAKVAQYGMLKSITEYGSALEAALRHKPVTARQIEVVERLRRDPEFQDLLFARVNIPCEAVRQLAMYGIAKFLGQAGLDQLTVAHLEQIGGLQYPAYSGTLALLEAGRRRKANGQG